MTGNIGEWSELYTLFKLLANGKLYAADADTNRIDSIYYEILKVVRNQTDGKWEYVKNGSIRIVEAATGNEVLSLPAEDFLNQSTALLDELKKKIKLPVHLSCPKLGVLQIRLSATRSKQNPPINRIL